MSYGLGILVGTLVILPLIHVFLNTFVLPKNKDADKYVDQYLENSRIIEVLAVGEYSKKSKTYTDRLQVKKNRGNITLHKYIFYSSIHRKYFAIMTFGGDMERDHITFKTRKMYFDSGSVYKAYNRNMVIVAAVNNQQWNDSDYGTEKKNLPIFGVDVLES